MDYDEEVAIVVRKRRWRCPECLRAYRNKEGCKIHGHIEKPIDIKTLPQKKQRYILTFGYDYYECNNCLDPCRVTK